MNGIVVETLRKLPLFAGLDDAGIEAVAERTVGRSVAKGTELFRQGEPYRGLYVVIEGAVQVYRSSATGREQVLIRQGPGQGVAEVPLFDGGPYPASGRMVESGSLLFLAAEDFHRLYREHPEIAASTIRELGRRLRKLVMLVEKISLREVHARVAAALLEYAEQAGDRAAAFRLPRTQEQMASELATTRESVSRAMARLNRERVIEKRGGRVRILDPRQLESIAISGGSGS